MRIHLALVFAALVTAGCGGRKGQTTAGAPADTQSVRDSSASGRGSPSQVVEVKMTGDGTTRAAYVPNQLTIAPGTTIRFVNGSGGPHNVTFYPDSIPAGAAAVLHTGMPNTTADLTSPLLTETNQTYDVAFANAPPGTYKAYCIPHVALGMKITITVQ